MRRQLIPPPSDLAAGPGSRHRRGLQQPGVPLLTLACPGGVGMTQLALAVATAWDAAETPAPVGFVSLAKGRDHLV